MPHKSTYAHPTIYLPCIRLVLLAAISRMEKCANNVNTVHARTLEHGYLVPTFCSWYQGMLTIFTNPIVTLNFTAQFCPTEFKMGWQPGPSEAGAFGAQNVGENIRPLYLF